MKKDRLKSIVYYKYFYMGIIFTSFFSLIFNLLFPSHYIYNIIMCFIGVYYFRMAIINSPDFISFDDYYNNIDIAYKSQKIKNLKE
jgi:hypothetical protein